MDNRYPYHGYTPEPDWRQIAINNCRHLRIKLGSEALPIIQHIVNKNCDYEYIAKETQKVIAHQLQS